ncbi:Tat pathway signal sequence domain protein [Streptomyces phaeofaciens]|uniref:Tat pathway signal sequence domain protein n=1 Tax=Streptomyces phaeofaciens TaxID=68254 RepID=UPI0036CD7687
MSGIGPVEPGEGTRPRDAHGAPPTPEDAADPSREAGPRPPTARTRLHAARLRVTRFRAAHRRAAPAAATAALLLAGGGYLYATRPHAPEPAAAAPPFPSQVVDVTYLGGHAVPPGTRPRTFAFDVLLGVESGPPVTVTRLSQPYDGLSLTSAPRVPFRTRSGSAREIVITMHVTECGKVPRNAGLPFLDVTLRNARAIQVHSFILGPRYAQDLSEALQVACSNDSR